MGHGSDRLYLTHAEHASGSYTAGNSGFQGKKKQTEFQNRAWAPSRCSSHSAASES